MKRLYVQTRGVWREATQSRYNVVQVSIVPRVHGRVAASKATQLQIELSLSMDSKTVDSKTEVAVRHKHIWTQFLKAWARIRTSQFWMVAIALFLRVGWIVVGHTYKFKSAENNFGFGWEMGRIGAAIAAGRGFSDAFGTPTGPTAWEPPLYPYLVAGVFHVFGIYSRSSAFVLLSINSVFSALTCIPIFLIARRMFSEKVAVGAAWTWALLPYVMFWCTRWVWETSLSALLLAVIFWLALTLEDREGLKPWLEFGLLWGIAALNSTVLVAFLPASGLWAWYRRAKRHKHSLAGIVLASLIFVACVTPWTVRNYRTFGRFIFIRDNFGAELRLGNGPGADGTWMQYLHPTQDVYAMRLYTSMGELAFIERVQTACPRLYRSRLRALCRALPEAFHLFLGGAAAAGANLVAGRGEEFAFPGIVGAHVLGSGTRFTPAQTRRVAYVLADSVVSSDLLCGLSGPALPPSH